jgi:hypothetical protein
MSEFVVGCTDGKNSTCIQRFLKSVGPFSILIERLQLLSRADTNIVQHLFRLSMNLLLCLSSLLDVLMVRIARAFNGF